MKCYDCDSYIYPVSKQDKDSCSFYEKTLDKIINIDNCEWFTPLREIIESENIELRKHLKILLDLVKPIECESCHYMGNDGCDGCNIKEAEELLKGDING